MDVTRRLSVRIPEVGQRVIMKYLDLDENFRKYAIKRFKNESVVHENSLNIDIFTKKRHFHRFFT
jgi:hypothetical protein